MLSQLASSAVRLSRRRMCAASTEASKEVLDIAERVCNLRLMDVKHLNAILRERLDIPEFTGGAMMAMPAAEAGAGAAEEVVEEEVKSKFNVKLLGYDKIIKIKLIKEIRAITELGLKEAKELVDKVPMDIVTDKSKKEAEDVMAKLRELGAEVTLE